MGTRHRQAVISKAGQLKIQQYGQWDGYPDGQGIEILDYLKNGNLDKFQSELENIRVATDEDFEEVNKSENWQEDDDE